MNNSQTPVGPPPIDIPQGTNSQYANLVRIAHSPTELTFDFAHLAPGSNAAELRARIIMSPLGAKLLQRALSENLARYEATFGEIRLPGEGHSLAEHLFRPPQPPEPGEKP
jgi:hypothetical protein